MRFDSAHLLTPRSGWHNYSISSSQPSLCHIVQLDNCSALRGSSLFFLDVDGTHVLLWAIEAVSLVAAVSGVSPTQKEFVSMNEPITTGEPRNPNAGATSWEETRRVLETAELFW